VLVVEDDAAVRNAMRLVLEEAGHTIVEAADGKTGLELLRASPELLVIVLDLMLPRMTGIEVLHAAGHIPNIATRAAFVVTTVSRAFSSPDLAKYLHGGYLAVLPKPFDIEDLVACAEEAGRQLMARTRE
jgi:two-component system chemotaxis response regulator CheY